MQWTEITITVDIKDCETAQAIANMTVPYGIYTEDYSQLESQVSEIAHVDLIDEELLKKDKTKALIHIYISPEENPLEATQFLSQRLKAENIGNSIEVSSCDELDWLNNWKQYFYPTPVGKRLLIRPTWRDDYDQDGRIVLSIDPGLAFGTGAHETTRLCLETLEKFVFENCAVLDVGCGSGILSIASVLLGAKNAFGVDIDKVAVKTANENAALNNVCDRFTAICGNLTDKVEGKFDIIVANIVADAIMFLSKSVKEFMHKDSVFIMSGIIDSRVNEVLGALDADFDIVEKNFDNGWYCLVAKIKE